MNSEEKIKAVGEKLDTVEEKFNEMENKVTGDIKAAKDEVKEMKSDMKSYKVKFSIGFQIAIAMIAVVIVACSVFLFYAFPQFEANIKDVVENQMMDKVTSEMSNMSNTVDVYNRSLRTIQGDNSIMASLRNESPSKYQEYLKKQMEDLGVFKDLVLIYPSGNVAASTNREYYHYDYKNDANVKQVMGKIGATSFSSIVNPGTGEEVVMDVVALSNTTLADGEVFSGIIVGYLDVKVFDEIVDEFSISGLDNLVTTLVDKEGYVVGTQVEGNSNIGQKFENTIIAEVLGKIASGEEVKGGSSFYNNEKDYLAYYVNPDTKWVMAMSVDSEAIVGTAKAIERSALVVANSVIFICIALAIFLALVIVRPIKVTQKALEQVAGLDFRPNDKVKKFEKKIDETGAMSKAIGVVTDNLRNEMKNISSMTGMMTDSANGLQTISEAVTKSAQSNTEHITAINGIITDTARASEDIVNSISQVYGITQEMSSTADESTEKTNALRESADHLKKTAIDANDNAEKVFREVKAQMDEAREQAKSVEKIETFTDSIMAISHRTKMLALNASIEAARAGEAGRGFAVVAEQIGSLALQSSESADNIVGLVDEIYKAVAALETCLERSLDYMESQVMPDYNRFADISTNYSNEAGNLVQAIEFLQKGIHEFSNTMTETVNSVVEISDTLKESASDVQSVKDENEQVVSLITETYELIQTNTELSASLENVVKKYILE